ncbi:MAG: helicase [Thermotogae bacterium]|nr:helicase [Thermotogota bacterium]
MPNNFITNTKERILRDRIRTLIKCSRELKFLVGFFYFSGLSELYQALKEKDDLKIKILVGLDTDVFLDQVVEVADPKAGNRSQNDLVGRFFNSLKTALNDRVLDTQEFYEQAKFFLNLLKDGRLEIRKTLEPNHAKLYLFRLDEEGQSITPGCFITGSSNLTRPGLISQHEFNVEIGDYGWEEAEAYFDELWETAIPLSEIPERKEQIIKIIERQTQIANITPFEAYALVLKTYLDLMEQKKLRPRVKKLMKKRNYRLYRYQEEAVQQALTVLDQYGGVILADVVGLGKSVIASWLARERGGRGIVICPPALMGDPKTKSTGWYKYLSDFELYGWEVFSIGMLDKAQEYLSKYGDDVKIVIVDEAHRFRNEDTEAYERLSQICLNREVILLTATPFNNAPSDIFALLKLFIPPGKSTLTLDEKLVNRFTRYNNEFRKLSYILRYHKAGGKKQRRAEKYYTEIFKDDPPINTGRVQRRVKKLADEIRAVIEPVVIRRNRLDLKKDPVYRREVTELSKVADPIELFYELTPEQSRFYDEVIYQYFGEDGRFKGAIYQPFLYEQGLTEKLEEEFTYHQQRNLYDFMRRLLVKRFESSFGAFAKSVENFIRVHENVLNFIEKTGKYILDRKLIEKIWNEDEEIIEEWLIRFAEELKNKKKFSPKHDKIYVVDEFADKEGFLSDIRSDLALFKEISKRVKELGLVDEDPKLIRLIEEVRKILSTPPLDDEPKRKVVIFTEYMDTLNHIADTLRNAFKGRVLVAEKSLSTKFMEELLSNFDASYSKGKQKDDYDILVATDRLSEGVNLNRAGAIINYDIPWNPTRVIQRLGRINRIGQKVFDMLYIYNFFPTEQGAEVVKSREIAAQKMFLIHNILGEDAKIFAPDETPTPAELFKRINRNPEELEEESTLTSIRREFFAIKERYPEVVKGLSDFPARVKTAKEFDRNELLVFRRKGLQMFIHMVPDTQAEKVEVKALTINEALPHIRCEFGTKALALSPRFWSSYEAVKKYRGHIPIPQSERSLMRKAENNLRSILQYHAHEFQDYLEFIKTLLRDIKEFQVLPRYTLRRLSAFEMGPNVSASDIAALKKELEILRRNLGEDYLNRVEKKVEKLKSEIIISLENRKKRDQC